MILIFPCEETVCQKRLNHSSGRYQSQILKWLHKFDFIDASFQHNSWFFHGKPSNCLPVSSSFPLQVESLAKSVARPGTTLSPIPLGVAMFWSVEREQKRSVSEADVPLHASPFPSSGVCCCLGRPWYASHEEGRAADPGPQVIVEQMCAHPEQRKKMFLEKTNDTAAGFVCKPISIPLENDYTFYWEED